MVIEEKVFKLGHDSFVQAFLLEVCLGLKLLVVNPTTKSVSVSKCHSKLILVVIGYVELACAVWTVELEVLGQSQTQILSEIMLVVVCWDKMVSAVELCTSRTQKVLCSQRQQFDIRKLSPE